MRARIEWANLLVGILAWAGIIQFACCVYLAVRAYGTDRDSFLRIAAKKQHGVSRLSVMPDHLHASLRAQPKESPLEIVFSYQNNLAYMTNQGRIWSNGFYVATFGEYSMQAVRNSVASGRDE